MGQISVFSGLVGKVSGTNPQQNGIQKLFDKYFEIPVHSSGRYKGLHLAKKIFKYLAIYNSLMYFFIWLICFILLKMQNKNKLTLLSSVVFSEEYLTEKVTSCMFYVCLLVYLVLEVHQQSFRKIYMIDWESHNLEELKETKIEAVSSLPGDSPGDSPQPNPEDSEHADQRPVLGESRDTLNIGSSQVEDDLLLTDRFDGDQSYMELVQSDEEVQPEPSVRKNYDEDLIQVRERDHPLNVMNKVYRNYLTNSNRQAPEDTAQNFKDFCMFASPRRSPLDSKSPNSKLSKTSAWRKIMITNSLNEVSIQLSASPLIILSITYCILEGFGLLSLGLLNRKGQSVDQFSEVHYFLRKYLIFGVVMAVSMLVWLARWLLRVVRGFACSELLDLCSVCNISLLVQLESGSFCYIHGKNHSGSGEGDLQSIYSKLVLEGTAFQATRGLEPKTNHQIFEVFLGSGVFEKVETIRTQAQKYMEFLKKSSLSNAVALKKTKSRAKNVDTQMDMKLFELLNEEVEEMVKEAIQEKNFTCKQKNLTEKLFKYEGLELLINLNKTVDKTGFNLKNMSGKKLAESPEEDLEMKKKSVKNHFLFYRENLSFFENLFLEGLTKEIILFLGLTTCLFDWMTGHLVLGIVISYLSFEIFVKLRQFFGEKNLVNNAKFDARFLI